ESLQQHTPRLIEAVHCKSDKLVTSKSSNNVRIPNGLAQDLGDFLQRGIANLMPAPVVDRLEVVQIHVDENAVSRTLPRVVQGLVREHVEPVTVVQTRQ